MKVIKGHEAKVGDILICVDNRTIKQNGHEIWVKVSKFNFAGLWNGTYNELWAGSTFKFVKIDNDQNLTTKRR